MWALARDGAGRRGAAQVGLRRGRVGQWAGRAAPGVGLGTGVGLRSTSDAVMATGKGATLAAVQPAALLTVGGSAVRVLLAILTGATAADEPAGVVGRSLAGVLARTAARLRAAW